MATSRRFSRSCAVVLLRQELQLLGLELEELGQAREAVLVDDELALRVATRLCLVDVVLQRADLRRPARSGR